MAYAQLGNLQFRIDPDSVQYEYSIDYSVINTLGGQVVQVLGSTLGDLTVTGSFGQDHAAKKNSWELAESFGASIRQMMDAQTLPTQGVAHQPYRFTFNDGIHNWNFKVLIKGMKDADGSASIEHSNGKFSYHYQLTLFIVQDESLQLKKIATDQFISRISNGLGWKASGFNGSMTLNEAMQFITKNSSTGTFDGYLVNLLEGQGAANAGTAAGNAGANPTPAPPPLAHGAN